MRQHQEVEAWLAEWLRVVVQLVHKQDIADILRSLLVVAKRRNVSCLVCVSVVSVVVRT